MAQSRLEKIGTVFTRVTGLLKSGAMKSEDKPIWYEVYAAFPPKLEPRFDRPAPDMPVKNIFYAEDSIRARYHQSLKQPDVVNLSDVRRETQSQQFIEIHKNLSAQGALDSDQIFDTAVDILKMQRIDSSLVQEAETYTATKPLERSGKNQKEPNSTINVEQLFKE